jgi:hypothetical protein
MYTKFSTSTYAAYIIFKNRRAQLDFTVRSIKPISAGHSLTHSFHYVGAAYKYLYGGAPYKSPKITKNRAACAARLR